MTKATHNGTCQACGRSQAYTQNGIAKHGYTTQYGFFMGTCSGSDKAPLELATDHNVATVAAIREWADEQIKKSEGTITKVLVSVRRQNRQRYESMYEDVAMTREEFVAAKMAKIEDDADGFMRDCYNRDFDKKVESVRETLRRHAASARKDADLLDALRDKTFGNELESRIVEDAPKSHRESFTASKTADGRVDRANAKAYDRQRELKAEGIRSRVTGDARYATITYRK